MLCLLSLGAVVHRESILQSSSSSLPAITCNPSDAGDCTCEGRPIGPSTFSAPAYTHSNHTSIYDTFAPMEGAMVPLSRYRARAAIVVNVASA